MKNKSPRPASVIVVPLWMRCLECSILLGLMVVLMWVMVKTLLQGDDLLTVMFIVLLMVFLAWLLCHVYSVNSVSVDSEGIAQSFLFHEGKFMARVEVKWDQVQDAWWPRFSYFFLIENGMIIELNPSFINDDHETFCAIRRLIPPWLLEKID
ncbi:MAG: hypothetical protein LBQ62_01950, partial [Candidatus Accumulibacter sp.]|nr:hypothetical protein [Accumulibacter sp.]